MMERKEIALNQIWKRKNGNTVFISASRESRGLIEFELTPIGSSGRKSWKWDGGIINELKFTGKYYGR